MDAALVERLAAALGARRSRRKLAALVGIAAAAVAVAPAAGKRRRCPRRGRELSALCSLFCTTSYPADVANCEATCAPCAALARRCKRAATETCLFAFDAVYPPPP